MNANEVFELFTSTIDMKYAEQGDRIVWLDETWQESKTPRTDLDWFVKAFTNDQFYSGNYQLLSRFLFGLDNRVGHAKDHVGHDLSSHSLTSKSVEVIENFKNYLFDIYTVNKV